MKDRDFLVWIHDRLTDVHGERPETDYMGKLRSIIAATDPEAETPNMAPPLPDLPRRRRSTIPPREPVRSDWSPSTGDPAPWRDRDYLP